MKAWKKLGSRQILGVAFVVASTVALGGTARATNLPSDWQDRVKLGVHAYEKGESKVSFDVFSRLMVEGGRKFGPSDGRMARIYTNLGEVYSDQQQYRYAEECLKRGLNVAEKGYGATSMECVPALVDLAQVYVAQAKFAQAEPLFRRALAIVNKPDLGAYGAVIEDDLGSMYFTEGNYAAAEPHFKQAFALATSSLGAGHKWTTTIGGMYAACLHAQGKAKDAKAVEREAVTKANEAQSPVSVWNTQMAAADAAMESNNFVDAESALKLALQAANQLTEEPMIQAVTLTKYGKCYVGQKKPALAIQKLKIAQAIANTTLGADDSSVLQHAKELADLERSQDQFADAEPLYLALVANAKKVSGPESDEYAAAIADIASVYNAWAQYPKAVPAYTKLLSLQEKKFGADSEKLIPTLIELATATQNNTQYFSEVNANAEEYLKRAASISDKKFGKRSKESSMILDALSRYYQRRLDWDKATKFCAEVIAADEKNYGENSPETAKALERYAVVLRAAGRRSEAEPVEARLAKLKGTNKDNSDGL